MGRKQGKGLSWAVLSGLHQRWEAVVVSAHLVDSVNLLQLHVIYNSSTLAS